MDGQLRRESADVNATAGLPAEAASQRQQASREGGSNSVVESQPSKLLVAGSIPVSRSIFRSPVAVFVMPADLSAVAPKARRPM